jgi:hypothetical protein
LRQRADDSSIRRLVKDKNRKRRYGVKRKVRRKEKKEYNTRGKVYQVADDRRK